MDGRAYDTGQALPQVFLSQKLRICLLMNFKYNPASVRRLFHQAFQLNILQKLTALQVPQNSILAVLGKERIQIQYSLAARFIPYSFDSFLGAIELRYRSIFKKSQEEKIR
jgi:hypothetical protein